VLHPAAGERLPLVERSNEGSMVLRFRFRPAGAGAATALLTGDIEERGVARLLSLETQLETGLLFYPHHGARNRLRETLLAATRPGQVIISAAAASGAIETAEALRQRGIAVHGTWMAGALRARLDAGGAWVVEAPLAARSAASAAGVGD
jgi:beta-lactamase superfamily II metal-dependent hydrolase